MAPTDESVRIQLARILQSPPFADSQRMARFLQFAVEETLQGRAAQLKENVIGMHVFDRPASYDPRMDPIVRVEARRLRLKLRVYYERHGRSDELMLEFPKGQYSPVFRRRDTQTAETVAAGRVKTIAVLPFQNLSGDVDAAFLSEGLTEDLIGALTRTANVRVAAVPADAGDDLLAVSFVLRGSLRRVQNRIRVLAHLIETATQQYVWSQTFDREAGDVLAIQDEIATAIVGALRPELTVTTAAPAQHVECYQLCLRGRYHARERTREGLERSALCFEKATQVDPGSACAYAGLADTYTLQAEYGFADGPEAIRRAKAAVERALELNPASAEAQASHALVLSVYDWRWDEAEEAFQRSMGLNVSYAPAHHWYGVNHLAVRGRFAEAETELDAAVKLDPQSPVVMQGRAYVRLLRRDYGEVMSINSHIIAGDPSFYKSYASMGRASLHMGDHERAIELLETAIALAGEMPSVLGALGQAYGVAGDRAAALHTLDKLRRIAAVQTVACTCFAVVHLGLDEVEDALNWIELAVSRRESSVAAMKVHPAYDRLRREPRFQAVISHIFPS